MPSPFLVRRAILFSLVASLSWTPVFADTVSVLLGKARVAESKGDTELALRMAQSAIVADPARPDSYVALAGIYAKGHQTDFARTYYDEALSIDPSNKAALQAVASLDSAAKAASASP